MLKSKRPHILHFIKINMLIVIPIEIKTREFLLKLYLIYNIIKHKDFKVFLDLKYNLQIKI